MENKRTETNKTVQKRLEPELKLINMDTVEVEQIEWLLYPFIPYGKVTIIQGDPGEGKTTMVLQIIAKLTRGETILPADSTKDKRIDIDSESDMVDAENIENNASTQHLEAPVNVIYQTAEDGLGDTIKPRLLAAGADCTKVMVIDDSEQPLTMADVRLEEAIVQTKARMVVLDPIQGFLGSEVDMHRAIRERRRINMSAKNNDNHNRFRSRTIAFRVSPEEDEQINIAVSLSGMTKQDYITYKLLDRTINVKASCKVHRAVYDRLTEVLEQLKRLNNGNEIDDELLENIKLITNIIEGLYQKK